MTAGSDRASLAAGERRRRRRLFILQMAPVLLFYVLFLVLPYATTLATSFQRADPVRIVVREFTLQNYAQLVTDDFFLHVTGWTVAIAAIVTVVTLIMGYPMAWKIVQSRGRVRSLMLAVVLSPLLVNLVVRTYSWQVVLGENGVVNSWLAGLGLAEAPLPLTRNVFAVVVGLAQITLPFMVLSLVSSMETLGSDLLEAAEGLGSTPVRTFCEIVWPLTLPGVSAGAILVFCYCTSAFVTPAVLGGGRVATIATQIYQQFMFSLNWPLGSALVVLLLVVNGVFIMGLSRIARSSID